MKEVLIMPTRPLLYAAKNIAWKSTVIIPILESLPLLQWRRIRVRHYLMEATDRMAFFRDRMTEEQGLFARRYQELRDQPEAMWWRDRCWLLRLLPRQLSLTPLLLQLKTSELLARLEARHPSRAYWSYAMFDLAVRVSVITLSVGMLKEGLDVVLKQELSAPLAGRITAWTTTSSLTGCLTLTTAHAVALSAIGELSGQEKRYPRIHQLLTTTSSLLYTAIARLPDALGDVVLLVSLPKLSWCGRSLAILRVCYNRRAALLNPLKHLNCKLSSYDENEGIQTPQVWEELERARLAEDTKGLATLRDNPRISSTIRARAGKYLDQYCFRKLSNEELSASTISDLFNQMSRDAQIVLTHLRPQDYERFPTVSVGQWIAQHEDHLAAPVFKTWALVNPAERYAYLMEQKKLLDRLSAVTQTPHLVYSSSLDHDDLTPWGAPAGNFQAQHFRRVQQRISSSQGISI